MSPIVCPKHLSVYMHGSIPDRYTADPTIDPTDDEILADVRFTDVSDGTTEDDIIALIDASRANADGLEVDADIGSEEYLDGLDHNDESSSEQENAARLPKTSCAVTTGNRLLDIEDKHGNDSGFIGSRRHAYAVLGQDIFENRMTSRRCNRTHSDSWKRNKVAKQYLRHEGRQTE